MISKIQPPAVPLCLYNKFSPAWHPCNGIIKPLVAYKLINSIAKPVINQGIILLLVFHSGSRQDHGFKGVPRFAQLAACYSIICFSA